MLNQIKEIEKVNLTLKRQLNVMKWYLKMHTQWWQRVNGRMVRHFKELWDFIISFPFAKDGPVYPTLKETRKEALKDLSLAVRESDQLL